MAMGMSANEYWHGEPRLALDYRKAYEIRTSLHNQEMWMQGLYFYKAVSSIASQILAKPGKPPEKYPQYPIPMTEIEQVAEYERKKQETLKWIAEGQK